jgi:hypothetical protein
MYLAVLDGIVLNGQWEATETNAGVFDCDECALLEIVLQHGEGPLEDGVDELDSYGTQAKGDEGWILASRQGNDRCHVEVLSQDDSLILSGPFDNGFVGGGCWEKVGHTKHIMTE